MKFTLRQRAGLRMAKDMRNRPRIDWIALAMAAAAVLMLILLISGMIQGRHA